MCREVRARRGAVARVGVRLVRRVAAHGLLVPEVLLVRRLEAVGRAGEGRVSGLVASAPATATGKTCLP